MYTARHSLLRSVALCLSICPDRDTYIECPCPCPCVHRSSSKVYLVRWARAPCGTGTLWMNVYCHRQHRIQYSHSVIERTFTGFRNLVRICLHAYSTVLTLFFLSFFLYSFFRLFFFRAYVCFVLLRCRRCSVSLSCFFFVPHKISFLFFSFILCARSVVVRRVIRLCCALIRTTDKWHGIAQFVCRVLYAFHSIVRSFARMFVHYVCRVH